MDYQTAYDINFAGMLDRDYKEIEYVTWTYYEMFMHKHYPTLTYQYRFQDSATFGGKGLLVISQFIGNKGECSQEYTFAVMTNSNQTAVNPDAVTINKNLQRAYAKSVARHTGFTLRLWSREELDGDKKGDGRHAKYRGLKTISQFCSVNELESDANFSWSTVKLREEFQRLKGLI